MRAALIAALVALAGPSLAAGPQWTWEAGKQTNNGAITIKSTNGSTTYSGTQNPTGAVTKINQNAVTQPPTIIIQATSGGGQVEVIPMLVVNTTTLPVCLAGYSIFWSGNSTVHGFSPSIFNAGGTRFSLAGFYAPSSSGTIYGWLIDNAPLDAPAAVGAGVVYSGASTWWRSSPPPSWAAVLCSK